MIFDLERSTICLCLIENKPKTYNTPQVTYFFFFSIFFLHLRFNKTISRVPDNHKTIVLF